MPGREHYPTVGGMGMVKTVGLVLHPRRDSKEAIDTIIEWARHRAVTVLGLPEEVGRIDCSALPVGPAELAARSDLMVSLGGDGTMLRAMRLIAGLPHARARGEPRRSSGSLPRSTSRSCRPR